MKRSIGALILAAVMAMGTVTVPAENAADESIAENEIIISDDTASAAAIETTKENFDPETVIWTNNPIENVLAQAGIYDNAASVNPNAAKDATNVQNPYSSQGTKYNGWEYSEFVWTNSYPIGNGRMAAMVAGGIDKEVIQINEDTVWDGSPYGSLVDENGNKLTTLEQTKNAEKINTTDQTSGSIKEGWRYYRGADENGKPAEIGSENALIGDEAFRAKHPEFANLSIALQALKIDNAKEQQAVQDRWSMEKMVEATFLGDPSSQRAYKSFAEVYLDFGQKHETAQNYVKSLDMTTGIVTVEYDYNGTHFRRESFASYPDQAVVTHIETDSPADFSAQLHTYHSDKAGYYSFEKVSDREVKLKAAVTNGSKDNNSPATVNAIQFEARMILDGDGSFSVGGNNDTISVSGAKNTTIYVVGSTNYVDYLTLDNSKQGKDCDTYEKNILNKTYDTIKTRHLEDFTPQFNKTALQLDNAEGADFSAVPTEKRVREDINGQSGFLTGADSKLTTAHSNGVYSTYSKGDNQLAALEFNYGKYLILSGSRDGRKGTGGEIDIPESQPLNLTGKWNAALSASWKGKYTININTEMNYWAAQPLGLSESERPLIDTFAELAQSGSITAANQYGIYNDRGDNTYKPGDPWVTHHNYDLWRGTQPIDNATAGLWPTGGAWLLDHAWQYYLFTKDEAYLAEVYPYMVGATKFFTQFLIIDPQTGYLVTAASCSPEQGGVQPGAAMDTQLIRNLYDMVKKASAVLGKTEENAELIAAIDEQMPSTYLGNQKGKLAPNLIDSAGLIKEWARGDVSFDISENDSKAKWTVTNPFTGAQSKVYDHGASNTTNHRHCSHLWEIFPGTHLSAYSDKADEQAIFKAFQKSVSARSTGSGQGWGLAWRIGLNARALDGNTASSMLEQLFTTRTSPNLFDQHPNFQIDGNYGATAGIIEMLIQSHDGTINLLPALPDKWQSGSFEGFRTRENAIVDLKWSEGKPIEARITATDNGKIKIRSKYAGEAVVTLQDGTPVSASHDEATLLSFSADKGTTYVIKDFASSVEEGEKVYPAADTTKFFASDNGTMPKIDGNKVEVGYIYNREGAVLGYAVDEFDFNGLSALTLNMPRVRDNNIYVIITLDTPDGQVLAKQQITTGNNDIDITGFKGISDTHTIWLGYTQDPYSNAQKYLGNAGDLTAKYTKNKGDGGDTDTTSEATTASETTTITDASTEATTEAPLKGDIDGNNRLTANDAAALLSFVITDKAGDNWNTSAAYADVDGIPGIAAGDAAAILSKVLNSAYELK